MFFLNHFIELDNKHIFSDKSISPKNWTYDLMAK